MDTQADHTILVLQPRPIRLVPNLSIAALQHGLGKELALWYCLRAINHWGSGRLDLEYAIRSLVDGFGYSKSAAYRIISSGDDVFWDKRSIRNINRLQIKIYGLKKVARYLDTRCGRYFLEISPQDFVGVGKNRVSMQRSWLYASFHKPEGSTAQPISRVSIQEATGVNRRSQQRYDKVTVTRVANYADWQDTNRKVIPMLELVDGKSRQWLIHKRLGNTYHGRVHRAPRGMLRRVNAELRQSSSRGEACIIRRFFPTAKSFLRCTVRHEEPFILLQPRERLIPGRIEWCKA